MRRSILGCCGGVLSLLFAGSLAAQTMGPPPYLQIFREEVKVGHGPAHVQTEAGWPRAFRAAKRMSPILS